MEETACVKNKETEYVLEDSDRFLITHILDKESGFSSIIFRTFNMRVWDYYSFKVPNGSCYVSVFTRTKVREISTGKDIYAAILFRRYQKGGYRGEIVWKIVKVSTRIRKWKCMDIARKWMCEKTGVEFISNPRPTRDIGEERRSELANRMLDCAGRIHNLPVFDINFKCSSCDHEWGQMTYEAGTIDCPECGLSQVYDKRIER